MKKIEAPRERRRGQPLKVGSRGGESRKQERHASFAEDPRVADDFEETEDEGNDGMEDLSDDGLEGLTGQDDGPTKQANRRLDQPKSTQTTFEGERARSSSGDSPFSKHPRYEKRSSRVLTPAYHCSIDRDGSRAN